MITTHQLAQQLLQKPDVEVVMKADNPKFIKAFNDLIRAATFANAHCVSPLLSTKLDEALKAAREVREEIKKRDEEGNEKEIL